MYQASELELNKLLSLVLERDASDLHLMVGEPPIIRVDSALIRLDNYEVLSNDVVTDLINVLLLPNQKQMFDQQMTVDFSYAFKDSVRFRVNAYRQKGVVGVALRVIPNHIKTGRTQPAANFKKIHGTQTGIGFNGGPDGPRQIHGFGRHDQRNQQDPLRAHFDH